MFERLKSFITGTAIDEELDEFDDDLEETSVKRRRKNDDEILSQDEAADSGEDTDKAWPKVDVSGKGSTDGGEKKPTKKQPKPATTQPKPMNGQPQPATAPQPEGAVSEEENLDVDDLIIQGLNFLQAPLVRKGFSDEKVIGNIQERDFQEYLHLSSADFVSDEIQIMYCPQVGQFLSMEEGMSLLGYKDLADFVYAARSNLCACALVPPEDGDAEGALSIEPLPTELSEMLITALILAIADAPLEVKRWYAWVASMSASTICQQKYAPAWLRKSKHVFINSKNNKVYDYCGDVIGTFTPVAKDESEADGTETADGEKKPAKPQPKTESKPQPEAKPKPTSGQPEAKPQPKPAPQGKPRYQDSESKW